MLAAFLALQAPPVQPPDTSPYMKAGYTAAAVIFFAYIALLVARARRFRR